MYGENNELNDLYQKFLEVLPLGKASEIFDEDDFIDIFDIAGDNEDTATQLNVLMISLLKYPRSRQLKERKGLYYLSQELYSQALAEAVQLPPSSIIGSLIKIQCDSILDQESDSIEMFMQYISTIRNGKLNDEEVIQLVKAAWALQCQDWLIENVDSIKSKCVFPQTLVYELGQVLFQTGEYTKAHDFLVELTAIEPFAPEYWSALAEIDGEGLKDYNAALQDLDYALAITPSSRKDLLMKAQYSILCERPVEEVLKTIDYAIGCYPDDYELLLYKASILAKYGEKTKALELIRAHCENLIGIPLFLEIVVDYNDNKLPDWITPEILTRYTELLNDSDFSEKISYFRGEGAYRVAISLMNAFYHGEPIISHSNTESLMDLYFLDHDYQGVIDTYHKAETQMPTIWMANMRIPLLYSLASFYVGRIEDLTDLISRVLNLNNFHPRDVDIEHRSSLLGCRIAFVNMLELLKRGGPFTPEEFNPFQL